MSKNRRQVGRKVQAWLKNCLKEEESKPGALPGRVVKSIKKALKDLRQDLKGDIERRKRINKTHLKGLE